MKADDLPAGAAAGPLSKALGDRGTGAPMDLQWGKGAFHILLLKSLDLCPMHSNPLASPKIDYFTPTGHTTDLPGWYRKSVLDFDPGDQGSRPSSAIYGSVALNMTPLVVSAWYYRVVLHIPQVGQGPSYPNPNLAHQDQDLWERYEME